MWIPWLAGVDSTTAISEIPAAVDPITDRYGQHRHFLICELHFQRTRPYHASAALRPDAPENLRYAPRRMASEQLTIFTELPSPAP